MDFSFPSVSTAAAPDDDVDTSGCIRPSAVKSPRAAPPPKPSPFAASPTSPLVLESGEVDTGACLRPSNVKVTKPRGDQLSPPPSPRPLTPRSSQVEVDTGACIAPSSLRPVKTKPPPPTAAEADEVDTSACLTPSAMRASRTPTKSPMVGGSKGSKGQGQGREHRSPRGSVTPTRSPRQVSSSSTSMRQVAGAAPAGAEVARSVPPSSPSSLARTPRSAAAKAAAAALAAALAAGQAVNNGARRMAGKPEVSTDDFDKLLIDDPTDRASAAAPAGPVEDDEPEQDVELPDPSAEVDTGTIVTLRGLIQVFGKDNKGRPIVVIDASQIPGPNLRFAALAVIREKMEPVVDAGDYVLVFVMSPKVIKDQQSKPVPTWWCLKVYRQLPRPYRKNVKRIVVIHPGVFLTVVLNVLRPVISSKGSRKIVRVNKLAELEAATGGEVSLEQVPLPQHCLAFDKGEPLLPQSPGLFPAPTPSMDMGPLQLPPRSPSPLRSRSPFRSRSPLRG